jgi:hypothetical protein
VLILSSRSSCCFGDIFPSFNSLWMYSSTVSQVYIFQTPLIQWTEWCLGMQVFQSVPRDSYHQPRFGNTDSLYKVLDSNRPNRVFPFLPAGCVIVMWPTFYWKGGENQTKRAILKSEQSPLYSIHWEFAGGKTSNSELNRGWRLSGFGRSAAVISSDLVGLTDHAQPRPKS